MLVVFVAGYGVGVPLSVANGNFEQDSSLLLAFAAFMVVGAIIVAHRPGNAVGWIFSAIGLLTATGVLATEYAAYAARTRSGSLPGVVLAAWYASWWWYPTLVGVLVFTPLVFPHRPAAVDPLATGCGGGGGRNRGDHPPERPAADAAGRGPPGPQSHRACGRPRPRGRRRRRHLVRAALAVRPRRSSRWCCGSAAPGGWNASS